MFDLVRRSRLRSQEGFSTVVVMATLMIGGLLAAVTFTQVTGGTTASAQNRDSKLAYAAAEAGLAWYQFQLDQDVSYWKDCTTQPQPAPGVNAPINQVGATAANRRWRTIPGATSRYSIDLLPAAGYTACSTTSPDASMIDPISASFRIRVTGEAGTQRRTVIATFRRASLIDFIWFTDYETLPPGSYPASQQSDAAANCPRYVRSGRTESNSNPCLRIQFASFDKLKGPFHTNDEIQFCDAPQFGRNAADKISISAPENRALEQMCSGGPARPNILGTYQAGAKTITPPSTNAKLEGLAGMTFTGKTEIELQDSGQMRVRNPNVNSGNWYLTPPPANGVIFVKANGCSTPYTRLMRYNAANTCGDLYIKGKYKRSLTFGTAGDVIITGDLERGTGDSSSLLGLVAQNFVRVYHRPTTNSSGTSCTGNDTSTIDNQVGTLNDVKIVAAMLALNGAFMADNWYCGAKLGTITVLGAIAQRWRGAVGTGDASSGTGYAKDYTYDDLFRFREPPYFLDPVEASWRVVRTTEQRPAVRP